MKLIGGYLKFSKCTAKMFCGLDLFHDVAAGASETVFDEKN